MKNETKQTRKGKTDRQEQGVQVDALVRTEITEIIEELSSEAPLDFMGTGSRASEEIAFQEWAGNKQKAVDALIEVALRAVIAEKLRCIAACEGERLDDPVPESDDRAYEKAIDDCIAAIRKA